MSSAGSLLSGSTLASATGSSQVVSGSGAPSELCTGADGSADMSMGSARLRRPLNASKQTLVAMR